MDLSVIIVNWNSISYLGPCLRSLYENIRGIDFEVIILDNASYDGSAALVSAEFPKAKFVQSEKNLGFALGNNAAFAYSSGKTLLLLNPDTVVLGDAVRILLEHLESLPDAGAIGCRLLNSDGTLQLTCIQAFPTILNQLLDVQRLKDTFPRWSLWGMRPLFTRPAVPVQVEMLCGACIMIRRSVFEQVDMFSHEYLMYGDDLDLCYKVKRAGYAVYYTDDAQVVHHGGKSSDLLKQGLPDVWTRVAIFKFLRKTRGLCYAGLYRAVLALASAMRVVLITCRAPFDPAAENRAARMRWNRILQWTVGWAGWSRRAREQAGFTAGEW